MVQIDIARRLVAESLGTALLVAAVIGSGFMAAKLAGGHTAIALLCHTPATRALLVVIITIRAPISGAHFNPAVSLVMAIGGKLDRGEAAAYMVVQIIGGCLGALFAHLMFGLDPFQLSTTARTGLPQWFAEFWWSPSSAAYDSGLMLSPLPLASTSPQPIGSPLPRPSPILP